MLNDTGVVIGTEKGGKSISFRPKNRLTVNYELVKAAVFIIHRDRAMK